MLLHRYIARRTQASITGGGEAWPLLPRIVPYDSYTETYKNNEDVAAPRRLQYVRHGKEFLVGMTGSRREVEKMKARIAYFMKYELHLEIVAASHVHIQAGSVLFLGTRVAGFLETKSSRRYSQELEKRRRSKARNRNLAEIRTEAWHNQLKDMSRRAWEFAVKKTQSRYPSWQSAEQAMYQQSQPQSTSPFVFEECDKLKTKESLQRLLAKEEEIFLYHPAIDIPGEILRAHKHLALLLNNFLKEKDDETVNKEMIVKSSVQNPHATERARIHGGIPLQFLAPIELIREQLSKKGILQPKKALPIVLTSMLKSSDEVIVVYFSALAHGLLSYYRCCDNFVKVRRLVDFQVRWSALFTLGCKHGCSARKIIATRHSNSSWPRALNSQGKVIAEFPSPATIARMGKKFLLDIQPNILAPLKS
jgi:hypothetical protein